MKQISITLGLVAGLMACATSSTQGKPADTANAIEAPETDSQKAYRQKFKRLGDIAFEGSSSDEVIDTLPAGTGFQDFQKLFRELPELSTNANDAAYLLVLASQPVFQWYTPMASFGDEPGKPQLAARRTHILKKINTKRQIVAFLQKANFPDSLHAAAARADLKAVKKFLAAGADPNAFFETAPGRSTGLNALHYALLHHREGWAIRDGDQILSSSLLEKDRPRVVQALLSAGADINMRTRDGNNGTPLMIVEKNKVLASVLRGAGAKE